MKKWKIDSIKEDGKGSEHIRVVKMSEHIRK